MAAEKSAGQEKVVTVAYNRMKKQNHEKARLNALLSASKGTSTRPAKSQYTILRQIVQWIPPGLPDKLAREANVEIRKFSCTSHVLALLYGHLGRAPVVVKYSTNVTKGSFSPEIRTDKF